MNSKDECNVALRYFIALVKNKFSCNVKTLRSNNGGEFMNHKVKELLSTEGITHQSSCTVYVLLNRMAY